MITISFNFTSFTPAWTGVHRPKDAIPAHGPRCGGECAAGYICDTSDGLLPSTNTEQIAGVDIVRLFTATKSGMWEP